MANIHFRLSHKIAAIGVVGVAGLAIVGGIYLFGEATQAQFQRVTTDALSTSRLTQKTMIDMLQARRAEKDFLLRSDEKYASRHHELTGGIVAALDTVKQQLQASTHQDIAKTAENVRAGFEVYAKSFANLVESRRKLGLDQDSGLEGTLRSSVHAIEGKLSDMDDQRLRADMLMLRRHEKDFMLRRDLKYGDGFAAGVTQFAKTLTGASIAADKKDDISQKLAAYDRDFHAWMAAAQEVARDQKAMSEVFASIEPQITGMLEDITRIRNDAEAANEAARSSTKLQIEIAILAVTAAVGLLALLIGRAVSRPLNAMTSTMRLLAAGRLEVAIPGSGRADEIGEMGAAVEVFKANAVERLRLEAEQKAAEIRNAAERKAEMHKLADDFEAAVGEIVGTVASASTELEAAARTLTDTADHTQHLSTVVASASEEAAANVQSVASAAEELTSSVDEIGRQVQESSRIANEAVNQAEQTDVRINELSQAADRIGDVVKLISAVAEQTNLLALNATIEAARAGEAGRGFAVVAQEVKTLAAQTAKATGEISTQIAGMQAATQVSVTAIKEIGLTIGRISEIATTIATTVEQQGAATQEISRNVQQAATGTVEVASKIVEVSKGAGETGSASSQVLSSAHALSTEGIKLKVEMNKFLATVRAA